MRWGPRVFAARLGAFAAANEFVGGCAEASGLQAPARYAVLLAFEEAFVNICSYAYPGDEGTAEVSCDAEGGLFTLELSDRGQPFDVLALPEPDLTGGVLERRVGGLGIHLIRQLSQRATYRRAADRNVLTMVFSRDSRPVPVSDRGE